MGTGGAASGVEGVGLDDVEERRTCAVAPLAARPATATRAATNFIVLA